MKKQENTLLCSMCYKPAELQAYGNTFCVKCYEESPYYAEVRAKRDIDAEKRKQQK